MDKDNLFKNTESVSLNLNKENLKSIPKEIQKLTNLTELSLSLNEITDLPRELFSLTKLKSLDLSFNQIHMYTLNLSRELSEIEVKELHS